MALGRKELVGQHRRQHRQQDDPVPDIERPHKGQRDENDRGHQHEDIGLAAVAFRAVDPAQQRRQTQDHQDIGRVRAHHIADGNARQTFDRGLDRHQKLGRRGAEGDHGQADDQGRDSQPQTQIDRAPYKGIARDEKKGQTGRGGKEFHGVLDSAFRALPLVLFLAWARAVAQHETAASGAFARFQRPGVGLAPARCRAALAANPKAAEHRQHQDADQKQGNRLYRHDYNPYCAQSALSSIPPSASATIRVPKRRNSDFRGP